MRLVTRLERAIEIPRQWYNIAPDLPSKLPPVIDQHTHAIADKKIPGGVGHIVGSITGIATCAVTLLVARPLLFVSLDPDVALARGVPTRALTALFLVLVAVTVAESVQAVGALLIFGLMVTPAAVAQNLSARPWLGMALSALIAFAAVWIGLVLSFYISYPASFFITALAFAAYLVSQLGRRVLPAASR